MSKLVFTDKELITATVASLKKWESVSKGIANPEGNCGFCTLTIKYARKLKKDPLCHECVARDICTENTVFWSEIENNPRKSFNPVKFKYQQRRIQKNIDWLKDYLMKLRAKTINVQCRMCEAGEYKSLEDLEFHLSEFHKLTPDELETYGFDFDGDIKILIYKEKRSRLSDEARERCA